MKNFKNKLQYLGIGFLILTGCGKVEEKANEISKESRIKGHWLLTESEKAGTVSRFAENEALVLSFVADKSAITHTNSVKGKALYSVLASCTVRPRPYKIVQDEVVQDAIPGECPERRSRIHELNDNTLKISDPDDTKLTRVFSRLSHESYVRLVKPEDQKL